MALHLALGPRAGWPFGSASGSKALLPSPQHRAASLFKRMFSVLSSQAELVRALKAEGVVKHRWEVMMGMMVMMIMRLPQTQQAGNS